MAEPKKRPNGKWRIEVEVRGRRRSAVFNTKTAAKEWGRWAHDIMRAGGEPYDVHDDPETLTFSDWLPRWRELRDVSPAQAAKADSLVKNHIEPEFGKRDLLEVAAGWEAMKTWVKRLRARSDLENSTVVSIYNTMSAIMATAMLAKVTTETPCHHIQVADGVRREQPWLVEDQVLAAAELCVRQRGRQPNKWEDRSVYVLIVTAAWTGLRWGELAGMRRGHRNELGDLTVDLLRRRVIVGEDTVLHEVAGKLWMGDPKSGAGGRIVTLPKFLVEMLSAHLATHDHEHVFVSPQGAWLRRSAFGRDYWRPAMAALLPDRPKGTRPDFHSLRHTQETMLLDSDIPDRAIDIRMGHVVPGAAGRYAHVHPQLDRRITDALHDRYVSARDQRAGTVRAQMRTLDA